MVSPFGNWFCMMNCFIIFGGRTTAGVIGCENFCIVVFVICRTDRYAVSVSWVMTLSVFYGAIRICDCCLAGVSNSYC